MRLPFRREPLISVVVPVYDVAPYLPACLDSILGQNHRSLDVVVVDDGSTDESGRIADEYAARDSRVRVEHVPNGGLGAARNTGLRLARGDFLAFADSDDVVPRDAYRRLLRALQRGAGKGADFATGNVARLEDGRTVGLPWMDRMHTPFVGPIDQRPELMGDVFAWNKLFRRDFWESAGLSWPERIRYEDQPTTTQAYVRARAVAVLPEVVYHWRIRGDGSAITEKRNTFADLDDRFETKAMSLATVRAEASAEVAEEFLTKVLPGDMWRYFLVIPGADDDWWGLLVAMVRELWGERSLLDSDLAPVHRLTGWLVTQGRRGDAELVMRHLAELDGRPVARVDGPDGPRLDIPGLDPADIDPAALALRPHEV